MITTRTFSVHSSCKVRVFRQQKKIAIIYLCRSHTYKYNVHVYKHGSVFKQWNETSESFWRACKKQSCYDCAWKYNCSLRTAAYGMICMFRFCTVENRDFYGFCDVNARVRVCKMSICGRFRLRHYRRFLVTARCSNYISRSSAWQQRTTSSIKRWRFKLPRSTTTNGVEQVNRRLARSNALNNTVVHEPRVTQYGFAKYDGR